jgi:hypothetical protein
VHLHLVGCWHTDAIVVLIGLIEELCHSLVVISRYSPVLHEFDATLVEGGSSLRAIIHDGKLVIGVDGCHGDGLVDMYGQHQNVTANYYPVNQAISMTSINSNDQFTVMNDRSQGGSALDEGRIELMQHRRVPADDNKGVTEFLNETDQYDNGIRVPASY